MLQIQVVGTFIIWVCEILGEDKRNYAKRILLENYREQYLEEGFDLG